MAMQSLWRRTGRQERSSDRKMTATSLPSRRRRALLSKPKGVKCAQETNCFNTVLDAKGGHQGCDKDGKDCKAFCLLGFTYSVNDMECKSVLLSGRDANDADEANQDSAVPATTESAAGLPEIPEGKPAVTTAAAMDLPEVPVASGGTSTATTAQELPIIPKAAETPLKASTGKKAVAGTKKSSSSSSFSSSSSSSSSSNADSEGDSADADKVNKDEPGLPAVESAEPVTTTSSSLVQSPSQEIERTDSVKVPIKVSTKADVQTAAKLPAGQDSATTKALEVDKPTSTTTQPVDTNKTSDLTASTESPKGTITEALESQASSQVLPTSSRIRFQSQGEAKASPSGGNSTENEPLDDTSGERKAEVSKSELSEEHQDGGEEASSTGNFENNDSKVPAITVDKEDTGNHTEATHIEDNHTGEDSTGDDYAAADHTETGQTEADQTDGNSTATSQMEESSKAPASMTASPGQKGTLASLDESLGSATAGITSKEKTAIAVGCAGVAVFIILVILATMNRNKLTKVLKRSSRISSSTTTGRQSLLSEASWTGIDSEKLDLGGDAPANPIAMGGNTNARAQDPRISHWPGSRSDGQEVFPQRERQSAFAVSPHHNERDNEELGDDWLDIASEGQAGGTSPNTLLAQHQSRFSASPRKRSFVAQSIIPSPGIIAKAFRIIVSEDKLKSTPALGKVPFTKKKGGLATILRLPGGLRSPLAKSPGSARRVQGDASLKSSLTMRNVTSPRDVNVSPRPPRTPPTPPKDIRNPFEDPATDVSTAGVGAYDQHYARQAPLPCAPVHLQPQVLPRQGVPLPYYQSAVGDSIEDGYLPPSSPRSSVSQSMSDGSHRSLALPGGRTPPMTPMSITRQPVSSFVSIPESSSPYIDVHHSTQRTMDFRHLDTSQEEDYEETFPQDAGDLEGHQDGGYQVPEQVEYARKEESWYTRSSVAPPSLLEAVPIIQEEIHKSRTRNTVRFADF